MLGTPYGELVTDGNATAHAKAQASRVAAELEAQQGPPAGETEGKKIIALIAYLQRMGTDIYRDPEGPSPLAMPGADMINGTDEEGATDADE